MGEADSGVLHDVKAVQKVRRISTKYAEKDATITIQSVGVIRPQFRRHLTDYQKKNR